MIMADRAIERPRSRPLEEMIPLQEKKPRITPASGANGQQKMHEQTSAKMAMGWSLEAESALESGVDMCMSVPIVAYRMIHVSTG